MSRKTIPAVSIIIPMYNAEKYVGECLDSILAQTFKDFEVIVVDDCSTDNSRAVVESYAPKFQRGGVKLNLICLEKNSGSGSTPRNTGLRFSRGEYLFFMDDDDAITTTALEALYSTAKKFDADVVHCDNRYYIPSINFTAEKKNADLVTKNNFGLINTAKPLTKDLAERLNILFSQNMKWEPWTHLLKRDLLMKHDLNFPDLIVADDLAFTLALICVAENFVLIPIPTYVWRNRSDSLSSINNSVETTVHRRGGDVLRGLKFFNEFIKDIDFFKTHPEYKYLAFEFLTNKSILISLYAQIPAHTLDDLVRKEIEAIGNDTTLTAFFFARMHVLQVQLERAYSIIREQQAQLQRLMPK